MLFDLSSRICPDVLRTTLILSHKEICEENTLKKFLHDRINRLTNEITNKEQLVKQYDPADKFLKPFAPTKTAQNGLNFVTKEEEGNLCKKEQPEIINVFKLIYILLNESYEELEPQKIIENLIQNLFVKYNVENISK